MPIEVQGARYFLATEVASELNVSRQTLWRWRQQGKIPAGHKLRDRHVVFSEEEVRAARDYSTRVVPVTLRSSRQLELF